MLGVCMYNQKKNSYLQARILLIFPSPSTKRLFPLGKALLPLQGRHKTGSKELDIQSFFGSHLLSRRPMRHAASPSGPFLLGSPLPAFGLRLLLSARPLIPAVAGQQGISSHRSSTRVAPSQGNQLWASAARSLCQRSEGFPGRRGCEPLRRRRERRMVLERSKPTWLMLKRNRFFFFFLS